MKAIIIASILGALSFSAEAARTWQSGLALTYRQGTNYMPYRLYLPYNYNAASNYPLVLFLHGSGEVGTDNTAQVSLHIGGLIDRTYSNYPAILVAPQLTSTWYWSAFNPVDLTWGVLSTVRSNYCVDERRIYVTGLSMGGFGATDYAIRFPNVFAAIAPMSGASDYGANAMWAGTRLSQVPTWLFHGGLDTAVASSYSRNYYTNVGGLNTITFSQTNYNYPTAVSGVIRYTDLTNQTHGIWSLIYANTSTALYDWMFAQTRPAASGVSSHIAHADNMIINASSDMPFAIAYLTSTADLRVPAAQWPSLATNFFDSTGRLTFTPPANEPYQFFQIRTP